MRMKKRFCFICDTELDWSSFWTCNSNLSMTFLKELWEDSNVELLCCNCFKKLNLINKGKSNFHDPDYDFIDALHELVKN